MNCAVLVPTVKGLNEGEITVGRDFVLNCSGTKELAVNNEAKDSNLKLHFFSETQDVKYILSLKEVIINDIADAQAGGDQLQLKVVSYVAGEHKLEDLKLTDGTTAVAINPVEFQVASVVQVEEGKTPEPFGYQFIHLDWPLSYVMTAIGLLVLILILFFLSLYKKLQFKNKADYLKHLEVASSPEQQFYRTLRTLEKLDYPVKDTDFAFRTYLSRKMQINFLHHKTNEALALVKKRYPFLTEERQKISLALKDIENYLQLSKNVDKQWISHAYALVDRLESIKDQGLAE